MAQARKKSTTKPKKNSPKSKGNSNGGGNQPLIILIILVVIGLTIFGLKYASENMEIEPITLWGGDKKQDTETQNAKTVTQENKENPVAKPKATEPKKNTPPPIEEESDVQEMVETVETNKDLPTYNNTDKYYFSKSFDFAWPKYTQNDQIIEHEFYALKYNEKTEQADWVAYKLTATNLKNAKFKRKDDFRPDPDVQTKSAHPDDYKGSGYDRGHLAPAADFTWDESGLSETFYMSNMSPQAPGFNRGIWRSLEEKVRTWAKSNNEVFVVTGPIYDGKTTNIGKNKVTIPSGYYKVILELQGSDVKAIAFSLSNESSSGELYEYALTVDDLEKATGMDFFPSMPDDLENKIESYYDYSAW